MAEYFAGGHLRFVNGEWRDDDGNIIEISRVRHGRWMKKHDAVMYWRQCSECGNIMPRNVYGNEWNSPYCPNCGAKMDLHGECEQEVER